ncbi:MAG: COP23 domain-containing protein [Cyanobacteria bacterium P01_H01_bin.15]
MTTLSRQLLATFAIAGILNTGTTVQAAPLPWQTWLQNIGISLPDLPAVDPAPATTTNSTNTASEVVVETVPVSGDPVSTPAPLPSPPPSDITSATNFTCQLDRGDYTVMYVPDNSRQPFPWAVPQRMGGGWTPERRCQEIARRLESYRPDGLLELTTGFENGYETICATTQVVPGCRIILTVPPNQNALATRDRIFNNLLLADSGQFTQGVTTFQAQGGLSFGLTGLGVKSSPAAIDLRPFLSPTDGGTGAKL